jgi:hypothetical protein
MTIAVKVAAKAASEVWPESDLRLSRLAATELDALTDLFTPALGLHGAVSQPLHVG